MVRSRSLPVSWSLPCPPTMFSISGPIELFSVVPIAPSPGPVLRSTKIGSVRFAKYAVSFPLAGQSVASFYRHTLDALQVLGVVVSIERPHPFDLPDPGRPFAETVYLTQTIEKIDGKLNRYLNLEDAFAAFEANPKLKREWRTHVHVPVFLDKIGEHFHTTRFAIEDALKFHKKNKLSPQLEIETYTWDVLPPGLKVDLLESIAREYDWVLGAIAR